MKKFKFAVLIVVGLCVSATGCMKLRQEIADVIAPPATKAKLSNAAIAPHLVFAGDTPPKRPAPTQETLDFLQQIRWIDTLAPDGYDDAQAMANPRAATPTLIMGWVFSSPYLANYTKAKKFNKDSVLVAIIDIDQNEANLLPNPLDLKRGPNCLFLRHTKGAGSAQDEDQGWTAYVTHPAPSADHCPNNPSGPKAVVATRHANMNSADYAPTARFEEVLDPDATRRNALLETIVGVKCGRAWCDVGVKTADSVPILHAVSSRKSKIKGWHDQQYLWTWANQQPQRSKLIASVYPWEDVGESDNTDFDAGWKEVATITIMSPAANPQAELDASPYGIEDASHPSPRPHPDATKKYKKWGLALGENTLFLKHDAGTGKWFAQVKNLLATTTLRVKGYMVHPSIPVPGATRWYWTITDDAIWIPCAEGCCTIEEDEGIR